jgi:hypothetical protein
MIKEVRRKPGSFHNRRRQVLNEEMPLFVKNRSSNIRKSEILNAFGNIINIQSELKHLSSSRKRIQ